jgi:hypothetical protein
MASDHRAAAVGYGHVQVRAIRREGASEAEYLHVACEQGDLLLAGQPQLGHRQTDDATHHTAGLLSLLSHPGLQRQTQVGR